MSLSGVNGEKVLKRPQVETFVSILGLANCGSESKMASDEHDSATQVNPPVVFALTHQCKLCNYLLYSRNQRPKRKERRPISSCSLMKTALNVCHVVVLAKIKSVNGCSSLLPVLYPGVNGFIKIEVSFFF